MSQVDHSNRDILGPVRAGFIVQGTTLTEWCRLHHIDPANAWKVLKGQGVGPAGLKLRQRLLTASDAARLSLGVSPRG